MQLDHITIRTANPERSVAFYRDVIGLTVGYRPGFSFPGFWLYHGDQPVVHLNTTDESSGLAAGPLHHIAFYTDRFDETLSRITKRNLPHQLRALPDGSRRQCFLRDPDGVMVEIAGR